MQIPFRDKIRGSYPIGMKSGMEITLQTPAGIIDSGEAQMKLNLNEWECTDMNVF